MAGKLRPIGIVRIVAIGMAMATFLFSLTEPVQVRAQAQAAAADPQSFEVASIRPSAGVNGKFAEKTGVSPGGRWTAAAISASRLIQIAYDLKPFQIFGGPAWLEKERFDIVAKAEMPGISPEQLKLMIRSLLAERFNLQFNRETLTLPVYALLVGKNGHKLRESVAQPGADGDKGDSGIRWVGKVGADARAVPVSTLPEILAKFLDRPVIDKTGLEGNFDFSLRWASNDDELFATLKGEKAAGGGMLPSAPSTPPIFKAVQDQLGLRLEAQKSPVEILVINRIEKAP